ncbi:glycosyltransferase [Paenibacillus sp. SI8]|uniref:glycosyltransferase n=1 Tax=unclassified Paenibacillus TaxID=185978 RepID=UPI0034669276
MEVKKKIKEMLDNGHSDIAKLLIREFEGLFPHDADMNVWKAEIHLLENKLDEAQRVLIEGIGYDHQRFDLYYKLAEVYRLKKEPTLAAGLYKRAMAMTEEESEKATIAKTINEISESSKLVNRPLVSIVVLAFNHVEYTQQCIESIYQYTSHIDFELITVNNGSSDETGNYFAQLPNFKKITLTANVGPVNGFNAGLIVADGTYTASISNDFVVTSGWLDNLLTCIESDETIGYVSPGASSVSNNQRIECPDTDLEGIQRFAESYNISNPALWEERVRLLPCVLMVRTELLRQIGYFDPRFKYGEFADDDISFRIRRAGYKLIFAKDTFTHHFGSVTGGEDQRNHRSLEVSREIFHSKYAIDAWDDTAFDFHLINAALESIELQPTGKKLSEVRILGINTKCGATPLQLRNKLREAGYGEVTITNYTDQLAYMEDLLTVSDNATHGPISELKSTHAADPYDIILFEGGLESYVPIDHLIEDIHSLLLRGGSFLFKMQNGAHFLEITRSLNDRSPYSAPRVSSTFFHLHPLLAMLESKQLAIQKIVFVQNPIHPQLADLYQIMERWSQSSEILMDARLSVSEIIIVTGAV